MSTAAQKAPFQSWSSWQPNPTFAPSPSPPPPPIPESFPSLFGPRSPRSSPVEDSDRRRATPAVVSPRPARPKPADATWSTWQPDPSFSPTPPPVEPTLMTTDRASPGLFGPRSPRSSLYDSEDLDTSSTLEDAGDSRNRVRRQTSWSTWEPDSNIAPSPPPDAPTLLIPDRASPGLFGPRSPRSSLYGFSEDPGASSTGEGTTRDRRDSIRRPSYGLHGKPHPRSASLSSHRVPHIPPPGPIVPPKPRRLVSARSSTPGPSIIPRPTVPDTSKSVSGGDSSGWGIQGDRWDSSDWDDADGYTGNWFTSQSNDLGETGQRNEDLDLREANLKSQQANLDQENAQLKQRELQLNQRDLEIRQREGSVKNQEEGLRRREAELLRRRDELASRQESLVQRERLLLKREEEVRKREEGVIQAEREREERKASRNQSNAFPWGSSDGSRLSPPDIGPQTKSANSSPSTPSGTGSKNSGWSSTFRSFLAKPDVPARTKSAEASSSTPSGFGSESFDRFGNRGESLGNSAGGPRDAKSGPAFNAGASTGDSTRSPNRANKPDWKTWQEELAQKQQEQLRNEARKLEKERLTTAATSMNKGQVAKSWAGYETWWSTVGQRGALHFHTISWPIFTSAKTPEDLTTASIALFVLSPHHSNGKSAKDRIKEQLLRWHPDRFEGKWLPLVPDEEKSIVREGMGQVVRALNELLNRES